MCASVDIATMSTLATIMDLAGSMDVAVHGLRGHKSQSL